MDSQNTPPASIDDKTPGQWQIRNKIEDGRGDVSHGDAEREGKGPSSGNDGPTQKRRKSRKGLDKKFECPQEGCGKSYSRAEHL